MSAFALKIIAVIAMIIDHTGAVFPSHFPFIFRCIGRAAFPIYVFFIAEGCRYTKNIWKYLRRLGIFALISEIPFDLCFNSANRLKINYIKDTNVFYTLFLGVLAVAEYKLIKDKLELKKINSVSFIKNFPFVKFTTQPETDKTQYLNTNAIGVKSINKNIFSQIAVKAYNLIICLPAMVPLLGCMYLAGFLDTDYGMRGVLWIFAIFLCGSKLMRLACVFVGVVVLYGMNIFSALYRGLINLDFGQFIRIFKSMQSVNLFFWCAAAAIALLLFYNGKRGKNIGLLFYLIYPVHLLLLGIIKILVN